MQGKTNRPRRQTTVTENPHTQRNLVNETGTLQITGEIIYYSIIIKEQLFPIEKKCFLVSQTKVIFQWIKKLNRKATLNFEKKTGKFGK